MGGKARPGIDRLLEKIVVDAAGCWLFQGQQSKDGYAKIQIGGYGFDGPRSRNAMAHRVTYEHYKGPIPDGLQIDHLCRVRHCVNPDHLEAVTQYVNTMRGFGVGAVFSRRSHCKNGHEFSEDNTRMRGTARICVHCSRAKGMEGYEYKERQPITHCQRGHEFTPDNTYLRRTDNCRLCRECMKMRSRKYYESLPHEYVKGPYKRRSA